MIVFHPIDGGTTLELVPFLGAISAGGVMILPQNPKLSSHHRFHVSPFIP